MPAPASGAASELGSAAVPEVPAVAAPTAPVLTHPGGADETAVGEPPLAGEHHPAEAPDIAAGAPPLVAEVPTNRPDAAPATEPAPRFWIDLASGLVELLTRSHGARGVLAARGQAVPRGDALG